MADISSVKLPNGSSYNFKDSTGRTTATNAPVLSSYLSVQTKSADNITVNAGGTAVATITVTRSGYTPIGVVGVIIDSASSSGTRQIFCHTYSTYLANSTTAQVHLRNRLAAGTGNAKVKVTVYVLYKLA